MNPWKALKELPRNMWTLFFATLINRAGTMVLPFLALYLTTSRGESADKAGLVLAFYGGGALLTAPFVGKLSDKVGALKVMKISLLGSGIVLFCYQFVSNFYVILAFTFIWAVISEAFRPANRSIISEVVTPAQRRTAYALNRLAINLGMSIGPVAAGFLTAIDFSIIFYVDGLTSILAGLFLLFKKFEPFPVEKIEESPAVQQNNIVKAKASIFKDHHFIYFLLCMIPVNMVYFQHIGAMPLYLVKDLGFSYETFGFLAVINTVLIILIEVPLNNFLSGWSDKRLLIIGTILTGIGFGLMAFAQDLIAISLTIVTWTFGEMVLFPASSSYIAEIGPAKRRGEYMGYFQMTFSLAFTAGPWLGTVVFEYFGAFNLWIGTFVFCLISALMMLKLKHKTYAV